MATKKQKRLLARQRFEEHLAEVRTSGLEAQRADREQRQRKELQEWQENHDKRHKGEGKQVKECPHCRIQMGKDAHELRLASRKKS